LKQKINNIIQCRIDITEQDKEMAIMRELIVLKRELLETMDEAAKQIQENTFEIMVKDEKEHERLVRGKERFFTYPMKVINVVKLEEVLAVLSGDGKEKANEDDCEKARKRGEEDGKYADFSSL
jgi:transcriptional regulator of heat shock response